MADHSTFKHRLKKILTKFGKEFKPSIGRAIGASQKRGIIADSLRKKLLKKRKEKKEKELTPEEKEKLYVGPAENPWYRQKQIEEIIKNREK